jgi:hypothetical protein
MVQGQVSSFVVAIPADPGGLHEGTPTLLEQKHPTTPV